MVAETISLGILALAHTLPVLGLIPGIILIISLGIMATYAGYVIGQFKWKYPHIHSMGDAAEVLFGGWGREIFGVGAALFIIFIMGAHIIAGAEALKVLTDNAACSLIWALVIGVTSFVFTLHRTLKMTTWLSAIAFLSVIAAVVITMVDLIQQRPGFEVVTGKMPHKYTLWGDPNATFADAVGEVTTIMFAFAGTVAFFPFISELENPKDFPKALAFLQIWSISLYVISAAVMYVFGGQLIESPALSSASPYMQKVTYGVAFGTIIIAGVINAHVAAKYFYVRLLRNNKEDLMHQRTWKARGIWIFICAVSWVAAWLLAMGVPAFDDMVLLTGALFASWFTFGLPGMFWCHMNLRFERVGLFRVLVTRRVSWSWRKNVLLGINIFYVFVGALTVSAQCFLPQDPQQKLIQLQMVAGLYASGVAINKGVNERTKPFSCH